MCVKSIYYRSNGTRAIEVNRKPKAQIRHKSFQSNLSSLDGRKADTIPDRQLNEIHRSFKSMRAMCPSAGTDSCVSRASAQSISLFINESPSLSLSRSLAILVTYLPENQDWNRSHRDNLGENRSEIRSHSGVSAWFECSPSMS